MKILLFKETNNKTNFLDLSPDIIRLILLEIITCTGSVVLKLIHSKIRLIVIEPKFNKQLRNKLLDSIIIYAKTYTTTNFNNINYFRPF